MKQQKKQIQVLFLSLVTLFISVNSLPVVRADDLSSSSDNISHEDEDNCLDFYRKKYEEHERKAMEVSTAGFAGTAEAFRQIRLKNKYGNAMKLLDTDHAKHAKHVASFIKSVRKFAPNVTEAEVKAVLKREAKTTAFCTHPVNRYVNIVRYVANDLIKSKEIKYRSSTGELRTYCLVQYKETKKEQLEREFKRIVEKNSGYDRL